MESIYYDVVLCNDGVTRGVKIINGTPQDPSLTPLKAVKDEKKKTEKTKVSIQDRINEQHYSFISLVEGVVDDFIHSDYKIKYDFYSKFIDIGCKSIHARKLKEFYIEHYNAMVDLQNGEDEYISEAWGHLKPKQVDKMMDFYGIIVDDLERVIKNASAQRKPRKIKQKSASKLIKNLKYQSEYPDLKLVSINPEKIVGASELWVYNTKYNKLGVYYAENSVRGFTVKGCTIQQFDEKISIQKTARKPEDVLRALTKRSLKKKLKEMKTKDQPVTGRINAQTILLGAF